MTDGNQGTGFDGATAVRAVGEGVFAADVVEGWDIAGVPHGGYLLALVTRAMGQVSVQPDPVSVSATYLDAPRFGPAEVQVEVVRAGKRQTTVTARLAQDGTPRIAAIATFGTLTTERPASPAGGLAPPDIPDPDRCRSLRDLAASAGVPLSLHRHLDVRLDPATGWIDGAPTGTAELNGWFRFPDRSSDLLALLLFCDAFPPSVFEAGGWEGRHIPTIELTTHLFARPDPSWIQGRFRTTVAAGSYLDEDGELWDASGALVATTRQLALGRR